MKTEKENKDELINKIIKIFITLLVLITGYSLAWYWFGWKLSLVIFLAIAGNNLENKWFS